MGKAAHASPTLPAPRQPRFKPSLNSFQSKRCTKIWHDKQRENGAIPIWNFNERTFAEDSGSQWSRFSWTPSVRSQEKHRGAASALPLRNTTYLCESERCQVSLLFWAIPRNNKYMKKPQNLITLDFCVEHGSTNKHEWKTDSNKMQQKQL